MVSLTKADVDTQDGLVCTMLAEGAGTLPFEGIATGKHQARLLHSNGLCLINAGKTSVKEGEGPLHE